MRLESMTLQAVGPFAGQFTVDFAALGASGLFLLEGPTGAGKSTLIDAVVFALYGKVASDDASADRVRSAYVDSDVESYVDLTFETGAGRFRVRRTPAFDRAKKRGSGTVRQQASVRLWRLPAEGTGDGLEAQGEVVATRLDEVGAEIQRIVGLDRTQFVQTIVLPQGEFARFLRADPEDRRGLLQKIFGTEVYERMQARLVELRRDADRATAVTRALVDDRVAHLAGAAALDDEALAPVRDAVARALVGRRAGDRAAQAGVDRAGSVVDDVTAALAGPLGELTEAAGRRAQDAVRAAQAHGAARDAAEVAARVARLVQDRADLAAQLGMLEEGADARDASLRRLEAARGARALRPLLRAVDDATVALDAAAKTLAAARDVAPVDLAGLVPDPLPAPAAPVPHRGAGRPPEPDADDAVAQVRAQLVGTHDETVRAAAALEHAVAVEESLQRLRTEVRVAQGTVEDHDTELAAHDAWLALRPAEADALTSALTGARRTAATEAQRALAVRVAQERVAAHERVALLVVRHDRAVREVEQGTAAALAAVEREAAARAARIAGLAGELAADLRSGDPCPVCGGIEHPRPAALDASHVTAEQVAAAEQDRVAAEAELGDARAALAAVRTELDAARAETEGTTAEAARDACGAATTALADARTAVQDAERLTRELQEHTDATEQRRRSRALAAAARDTAAALVDVRTTALAEAEAVVAQARAGHPTVAARHTELVERASVAADLRAALDGWLAAATDEVRRRTELDAARTEHGFVDEAAARSADLPDATAAALEDAVREHDTTLARVRHRLDELAADPLLAGLGRSDDAAGSQRDLAPGAGPEALLAAVRTAAEAAAAVEHDARERARAADTEAGVAQARASAAQSAAQGVLDAIEQHVALLGRSAPVLRLAGLASGTGGDNGAGLSLATYVLVRRFEDVVAAANARLVGMSDGRFELVRSDQKEDVRSRRQGLAMRVLDHRTEQERDPRTLSGGETFYVSLCLALGMADVVTAEAGGIDLGTLFVDEGFGSLDPHTLDQVLSELDRLRAGGRVVGVVSHVETLKQTIADRIEVRGTGAGPSTLTVRAG